MILQNNPFGEHVEGLSYCGNKTCVIKAAVQKDDFQYSTFCVISGKRAIRQGLRKSEYFHRNIGQFISQAGGGFQFQSQVAIRSRNSVFFRESIGFDLAEQTKV